MQRLHFWTSCDDRKMRVKATVIRKENFRHPAVVPTAVHHRACVQGQAEADGPFGSFERTLLVNPRSACI